MVDNCIAPKAEQALWAQAIWRLEEQEGRGKEATEHTQAMAGTTANDLHHTGREI